MSGKNKSGRSGKFLLLLFLIIVVAVGYYYWNSEINGKNENVLVTDSVSVDSVKLAAQAKKTEIEFMNAVTDTSDSNSRIIYMSSPDVAELTYSTVDDASKPIRKIYTGKRINIAVTGLDNRLGTRSNHADANHVISFLLDSGLIEVISIPRDTPAEANMPDTSGQNKLTIVRANRGRESYQKELARIAGVDRIHYFIEGGFSQVMGLIEFFGFKDSKSTLQVLRSRTGLGGDDYQRCYNQGQFMRQMMLRHFGKFSGLSGEILIRGGLTILETDLTTSIVKDIIDRLDARGFPKSPDAVKVRIRPPMYNHFKVYNFADEKQIQSLKGKIENFNESHINDTNHVRANPLRIIKRALDKAVADSAKRPQNVINALSTLFSQRAWLQISDLKIRDSIRQQFAILLSTAYYKKKQPAKAQEVWNVISTEQELFKNRLNN
jgi:uncharacterized protein (UPF0333 family)